MPRPRRFRRIMQEPGCAYFKPWGVGLCELDETQLKFEELEALRLKDFEGMDQVEAAKKMDVSQPTFHRILGEARKKVATALVKGMAIKIYGGRYKMPQGDGTGPEGKGPKTGRGLGKCEGNKEGKTSTEGEDLPRGQGRGFGRGRRGRG
jgi:uncharacterized protein